MKGTVLDLGSFYRKDLNLTEFENCMDAWQLFDETETGQVLERINQSQVVVSNKVKISSDMMAQLPSLKLICVAATGYNNIDIEAAKKHHITVCNVRDYATPSVVQHVFSLILSLSTNFKSYQQAVSKGLWNDSKHFCLLDYPIAELSNKTIGIIGYGVLGQAIEKVAQAFGMNVLIAERQSAIARQGRVSFDDVIAKSDVISIHCPLTSETKNLIDEKEFQQMKASAILINAARGGIVNETALLAALKNKQIAGTGLDVLTIEPPANGSPLIEANMPNLIVTPHIAWASLESRQRMIDQVAQNILAFRAGKAKNVIA